MTINILPFTSRMQSTCISGKPQVLNTIPLAYSPKYKIPAQTLFYHFPSDFHWQMVSPAEGFSALPWHVSATSWPASLFLRSLIVGHWESPPVQVLRALLFPPYLPSSVWPPSGSAHLTSAHWVSTHSRRYSNRLPLHSLTDPISPKLCDIVYPSADFFLCYSQSSQEWVEVGHPRVCVNLSLSLIANDCIDCRRAECPVSIPREDCGGGFSLFHFPFKDSLSFSLGICCCN